MKEEFSLGQDNIPLKRRNFLEPERILKKFSSNWIIFFWLRANEHFSLNENKLNSALYMGYSWYRK